MPVGYMYRTKPSNPSDSGWAFLAGDETQAYMDEPACHGIYDVNTIANYDPHIILFLDAPEGSQFVRGKDGLFRSVEELDALETVGQRTVVFVEKQVAAGASYRGKRRKMVIAMWVLMSAVLAGCVAIAVASS